jgi:RNA polymerase sigma factor (sigma-70 family)
MSDSPDAELLKLFARNNSEAAFAELVERYIGLVYSTAFRKTGNPQQSEDITQAVFIILARKANSLGPKTVLPGWLHHTARLTAANLQRAELRRIRREQEAFMQSTVNEPTTDELWRGLSPLLDDAVASLGTKERDAIVLRFFQNRSLAEVGTRLGASEDGARMRVNRALEKLRKFFNKRGVVSTTAIIAGAIAHNSVQAAPIGLAAKVTATAAQGASLTASTLFLVKGTMKVMAWTKARLAVGASVVALLAVQYHQNLLQVRNLVAARESLSATNSKFASQEARIAELDQQTAAILETRTNEQEELNRLQSRRKAERSTLVATTAATTAAIPGASVLSQTLQDPDSRELLRQNLANAARFRLAPLIDAMKLEQSDKDKLIQLNADWGLKNLEAVAAVAEGRMTAEAAAQSEADTERDTTNQVQSLLGETGLAKFEECQQTFPARALVQQFDKQLGAFPLNAYQRSALSQLILAEPLDVTSGLAGDLTVRSLVFPEELNQRLDQQADVNARILQEASAFLTPEQVESLKLMQTANLSAQKRNAIRMLRKL